MNKTTSAFTSITSTTSTTYLTGIDLSRTSGDRNVRILASNISAGSFAPGTNVLASDSSIIIDATAKEGYFAGIVLTPSTGAPLLTAAGDMGVQFGTGAGGTFHVDYYNNSIATTMLSVTSAGVRVPQIKEAVAIQGALSGTVTFDLSQFSMMTGTASSASITIVFAGYTAGYTGRATLIITNGGLAASISYGASGDSVLWTGGLAPTLSASGIDVLSFFTADGVTWFGSLVGRGFV
jgi:hypothetical protein